MQTLYPLIIMKKHRQPNSVSLISFLAAIALLLAVPALPLSAEDITWDPTLSSGDFNTASNWLASGDPPTQKVPGSSDKAIFENEGALAVSFSAPLTQIATLQYEGQNLGEILPALTFNLNGNSLELSGNLPNWEGEQTLTLSNGTVSSPNFTLSGSTTTRLVDANLTVTIINQSTAGGSGGPNTALFIDSTSTLTANGTSQTNQNGRAAVIGVNNGNSGSIYIEGGSMIANNVVTIGGGGAMGSVEVSDGGSFSGTVLSIGRRGGSGTDAANPPTYTGQGSFSVTGLGSTATADQFYVGGGRRGSTNAPTGDANGTASFTNGGTGNFGLMRIFRTEGMIGDNPVVTRGTLIIDNATVNITGTGTAVIDPDAILRIGLYNPSQAFALNVGGAFTITNANFELFLGDGFSADINDTFSLVNYGSLVGTFAGLDDEDEIVLGGYTFQIDYNLNGDGEIGLLVTAIPEPAAGLAVGLLALLFAIRRARKKN